MLIFEQMSGEYGNLPKIEGISPIVTELLARRGALDEASMRSFLHPSLSQLHDPFKLRDMDKAVLRIREAIADEEEVWIYGDYDVDGICAVSMLVLALKKIGAKVHYYIPTRQDEGYGLNEDAIRSLRERGAQLLITVDNGVRACREAELCAELGMDLIVTDHHLCDETLPKAKAVVCHTRKDDSYPNPYLCGAGTAYKLIEALFGTQEALAYLPLAGIATIADVVPLLDENRVFAALAIQRLNSGDCPKGIMALLHDCGAEKVITARDIAFGIAPRLNAAGRLADASLGVELLCESDDAQIAQIAQKLEALNAQRQQEEMDICQEAYKILDASDLSERRTIVLKGAWNCGVIGIAASRIAERYYRPTILFSEKDGILTGSARSIPGVHLYAALLQCGDLFLRFGGHAAAAGAALERERYAEFCARFENAVCAVAPDQKIFLPRKQYELDASLSALTVDLAKQLTLLAPFGEGNPAPLFRISCAYLRNMKRIGTDRNHLSGVLCAHATSTPFVYFGMGDFLDKLLEMDRSEVLCEPSVSTWRGVSSLQVKIKAVRPSTIEDVEGFMHAHSEKFVDAFSRNILYNDKCMIFASHLDDADLWLCERLKSGFSGLLTLCFTREGASRLLAKKDLCAQMDIGFYAEERSACAYHALVLAPVLEKMLPWRYREILIYDTPVKKGILAALSKLSPYAKLYIGNGDASELKRELYFDRSSLIPMYTAFRNRKKSFYNRDELADFIAKATGQRRCLCRLGVDIMVELGFAREKNGITFVEEAPQTPLENSKTFQSLISLGGEIEGGTLWT